MDRRASLISLLCLLIVAAAGEWPRAWGHGLMRNEHGVVSWVRLDNVTADSVAPTVLRVDPLLADLAVCFESSVIMAVGNTVSGLVDDEWVVGIVADAPVTRVALPKAGECGARVFYESAGRILVWDWNTNSSWPISGKLPSGDVPITALDDWNVAWVTGIPGDRVVHTANQAPDLTDFKVPQSCGLPSMVEVSDDEPGRWRVILACRGDPGGLADPAEPAVLFVGELDTLSRRGVMVPGVKVYGAVKMALRGDFAYVLQRTGLYRYDVRTGDSTLLTTAPLTTFSLVDYV